jgi:hypothetical protein
MCTRRGAHQLGAEDEAWYFAPISALVRAV